MKLLLDTHHLLWSIYDSSKLSKMAHSLINNRENEPHFSVASLWGSRHQERTWQERLSS